MSIWRSIDRDAFEADLAKLCRTQKLQDPNGLPRLVRNNTDHNALSLVAEGDLADSFAFLAASTNQPAGITACAIRQSPRTECVSVVLTANEGITEPVANAIRAVVDCLKQQAARSISDKAAEHMCRGLILNLHRNRIFGRLGSAKAKLQKSVDINIRVRAQGMHTLLQRRKDKSGVRELLQVFMIAICSAERSEPQSKSEQDALRCVLDAAYNLMHGSPRLVDVLPDRKTSKEYRALRALANYWRTCQFLVKCTGRNRAAFRQLDLEILASPPFCSSNHLRRYIHAEIQLVLHLEQKLLSGPSRYISSSKKPCFLCYTFVRAHGKYGVCQSHGEVYEMWTVPDDIHLNSTAKVNINQALAITARDVRRALSTKAPVKTVYLHPVQTVSKILLDRLSSGLTSIATAMDKLSVADRSSNGKSSPEDASTGSWRSERTCGAPTQPDSWTNHVRSGQIELFLDTEPGSHGDSRLMKLCTPSDAGSNIDQAFCVNVEEMNDCEEVTTTFPDHTSAFLILMYAGKQSIVQLRWH